MKKLKGFTLIELIVVVAIIGVLIAIIAPSTKGSPEETQAQAVRKAGESLVRNYIALAKACNQATSGPNLSSNFGGAAMTRILVAGPESNATFNTNYGECYRESGITNLKQSFRIGTGLFAFQVADVPMQVIFSDDKVAYAVYSSSDSFLLKLISKYESISSIPSGGVDTPLYFLDDSANNAAYSGRRLLVIKAS